MDERDDVPDADTDLPDEDGDGEDLFDDNLLQDDHATNVRLDTYSNANIDDEGEYQALSAGARHAAEMEMARRDALTADVAMGKEPHDTVVHLLSCRTTTTKLMMTPVVACWLG